MWKQNWQLWEQIEYDVGIIQCLLGINGWEGLLLGNLGLFFCSKICITEFKLYVMNCSWQSYFPSNIHQIFEFDLVWDSGRCG